MSQNNRWDFYCRNHASTPSKWGWVALAVVILSLILISTGVVYYVQ